MTKLVLDTNILLHIVRGDNIGKAVKNYINRIEDPQVFISIVTLAEAGSLAIKFGWGESRAKIMKDLIDSLLCINLTTKNKELIEAYINLDAFSQGKISAPNGKKLNNSARNMGKNDLWIAATVYAINAELLTTDADFNHLKSDWIDINFF